MDLQEDYLDLKARFTHGSYENYPKDALHMYAEKEVVVEKNDAVLNDLPAELYTIEADKKCWTIVNIHCQQFKLL